MNVKEFRRAYQPKLPKCLQDIKSCSLAGQSDYPVLPKNMEAFFQKSLKQNSKITLVENKQIHHPKKVGVVLSGGQASGGHNVICGLHDALKQLNPASELFGFLDGPKGLIENKKIVLTDRELAPYRNQGGFDLLGSGRTKIETNEQFQAVQAMAQEMNLDGIVIIGGDDSNTNAALLAEFFLQNGCKTTVVGVPKTIDGDLKNEDIEISFGFDTAVKTYSELIGNILTDSLSAKKYYYFIKLMGRSASHITLECALQTHPNIALISEEIAEHKKTLKQIRDEICDLVCERAKKGKHFGAILIPEGIIEFIPEFNQLIQELNLILSNGLIKNPHEVEAKLSKESKECYQIIPQEIKKQLLLERDPHGNVQVSKIETERLLIGIVADELEARKRNGRYAGKFAAQPIFCGYEGRSGFPSNFDANYCYSLGFTAALIVDSGSTGYITYVKNLAKPVDDWIVGGRLLATMMGIEIRSGKEKPVIKKALVDTKGKTFQTFKNSRLKWAMKDTYQNPGPIQFFGPAELTERITFTVADANL